MRRASPVGADVGGTGRARPKAPKLRIAASVKRVNHEVGKAERIARHRVLDREFSQDAGEITATLKLRQRRCAERFAGEIDQLYADRLAGA